MSAVEEIFPLTCLFVHTAYTAITNNVETACVADVTIRLNLLPYILQNSLYELSGVSTPL